MTRDSITEKGIDMRETGERDSTLVDSKAQETWGGSTRTKMQKGRRVGDSGPGGNEIRWRRGEGGVSWRWGPEHTHWTIESSALQ